MAVADQFIMPCPSYLSEEVGQEGARGRPRSPKTVTSGGASGHHHTDRAREDSGAVLSYKSITVTGEVFDAFDLVKKDGKPRELIDRIPAE